MNIQGKRRIMFAWALCSVLALLGLVVMVAGFSESKATMVFGGLVMLAMAGLCLLHESVVRTASDALQVSREEKAAWTSMSFCIAALLLLGQMVGGMFDAGLAAYLILAAYVVMVVFYPAYRRQWLEKDLRSREVLEDERDLAIRAQGERWAKRSLEFALVALALMLVAFPRLLRELQDPLQVAGMLLGVILTAIAVGEARTAVLHWRDRQ